MFIVLVMGFSFIIIVQLKLEMFLLFCILFTTVLADQRDLIPLEAPTNLTLEEISGKNVIVSWDSVNPESIRGHFRGYQVRIWNHAGSQVYALSPETTRVTLEFFPFSKNFITVSARNDKYFGPPSEAISFDAPQIEPNYPYLLQSFQLGADSVLIKWSKPTQPNGILIGYKVYISELIMDKSVNEVSHKISDPDKLQAKLTGFKDGLKYKVSISALNCAGESQKNSLEIQIEEHQPSEPFVPDFIYKVNYKPLNKEEICLLPTTTPTTPTTSTISVKDYDYYDYFSDKDNKNNENKLHVVTEKNEPKEEKNCLTNCFILWLPDVHNGPGDHFYVKYRLKGEYDFNVTEPEISEDFIIIEDFDACKNYEIVVTSVDGDFKTNSKIKVTPTFI